MALIRRARDTGMPALSGPLILAVDPTQSETGLVMRLALYRKNAFTPNVEQRREAFVGVAKSYSESKHISYASWRDVGVAAGVLKRAGISRAG